MYIAHRVNSSTFANSLPVNYGIEFDLRDSMNNIIVTHDAFTNGEDFDHFLSNLNVKRFLIVNIKCEGIEERVIRLLNEHGFNDFFLLDCSFPSIIKLNKREEKRIAMRFSEFEPIENIVLNKDKIQWVWVDCFKNFPLTKAIESKIHAIGLKICIVSPELQEHGLDIEKYSKYINDNKILIDAICTKEFNIQRWSK